MKSVGTAFTNSTSGFVPNPGGGGGSVKALREDGSFAYVAEIEQLSDIDVGIDGYVPVHDPTPSVAAPAGTSTNSRTPLQRLFGLLRPPPGGRLCFGSGDPYWNTTTLSTVLYYTPCEHDILSLWDGTRWLVFQVPEFAMPVGTLVTCAGYDVNVFTSAATPSSTDTTTDVVTFGSATGWATGSVVWPASTLGGLTGGTAYFYNAASSTTGTFHTTLADALAGTNKVNLTASITQSLRAVSMELATWKNATFTVTVASPAVFTTSASHGLAVGDPVSFSTTGALPTGISANTQYFVTLVSSTTFRVATTPGGSAIGTSGTQSGTHTVYQARARQTALALQDGRWVVSGTPTRLNLGSFRAWSTTQVGYSAQYPWLWNRYNQIDIKMTASDTTSHSYNGGYRAWNNSSSNKLDPFSGEIQPYQVSILDDGSSGANIHIIGMGLDQLVYPNIGYAYYLVSTAPGFTINSTGVALPATIGAHSIYALQSTASTGSATYGMFVLSGIFRG